MNAGASRVVVAVRVRASPERAFEAFTRDIGLWWEPNTMFRFTPRSPGRMAFEPPTADAPARLVERLDRDRVFEVGRVSVWEPGRRIVMGWRQASFGPDYATEVDIRFEPAGPGATRVVVEHRGWDTLPQEHVARHGFPLSLFLQRHGEYWRLLLGRLDRFAGEPSPEAGGAAIDGGGAPVVSANARSDAAPEGD